MTETVIAILGPTASGKSEVAQRVCLAIGGEVVSADSMQIYRRMDIGTAKVPAANRLVTHHLIDILEPGQSYSAQLFQEQARECFSALFAKSIVPVLCGGTGLYVQAALEDMRFPAGEQEHNEIRQKYEALCDSKGADYVWQLLADRDSESASLIHPHNARRVIRALEMNEQGISYARQVENIKRLPKVVPSIRFALQVDPDRLAERINRRVDQMFEMGLVEEVKGLLQSGFKEALTAPQAIGYKEIVAALEGACTLEEAREDIKTATRRYAKRQRSWLKRDSRIQWIDSNHMDTESVVELIVEQCTENGIVGSRPASSTTI